MNQRFAVGFGIGVVVLALGVYWGVLDSKGNHLDPTGKIGKVRTLKMDENATIVVVDFKVRNDADVAMTVRDIAVSMAIPGVGQGDGRMIAAPDLEKVFRNYPELGERYNPPLKVRDPIAGHAAIDRMVGIQFDLPEQAVASRSDLTVRIEDISGVVLELHEKSSKAPK
jgi:hypothetical protein